MIFDQHLCIITVMRGVGSLPPWNTHFGYIWLRYFVSHVSSHSNQEPLIIALGRVMLLQILQIVANGLETHSDDTHHTSGNL